MLTTGCTQCDDDLGMHVPIDALECCTHEIVGLVVVMSCICKLLGV